jgi:phytanoyl-CoA hydroxylase
MAPLGAVSGPPPCLTAPFGTPNLSPKEGRTLQQDAQPTAGEGHEVTSPVGDVVTLAHDAASDPSQGVPWNDAAALKKTYEEEGWVLVRGLIPRELLKSATDHFESEILTYPGFLYRQASATPERHELDEHGHMLNSLLNIQDLRRRPFPGFRGDGLAVITHERLQSVVKALFGEPGKTVMSMFFDGNPVTWAHQDTYYLDSEPLGNMVAAWIAAEDIAPGAGRFYVYPKSHLIEMPLNSGELGIATDHTRYKKLVLDVIREQGSQMVAPALSIGDVLFWNSRTIHGSLATTQPGRSRRSFTTHFIPESGGFLQFQSRRRKLRMREVNGMQVVHQKDQERWHERLILETYGRFPKAFHAVRNALVKLLAG